MSLVLYALVGLGFILAPTVLGDIVHLDLADSVARTDVRAVYGGLDLGLALFLLWCTRNPGRTAPAIVAATTGVLGLAIGRSVGLAVDGLDFANVGFLAMELSFVLGGVIAWRVHTAD